jgi:hypothetical protein
MNPKLAAMIHAHAVLGKNIKCVMVVLSEK